MRNWVRAGCGAAALWAAVLPARAQVPSTPPEAAAPGPALPATPPAQHRTQQHQMVPNQAVAVLGTAVTFGDGEPVGRLVDVLVDEMGKPAAAVLDCGGFLGMGSRRVAVAWNALHFAPAAGQGRTVTIELTPDEVRSAPEYKDTRPAAVVTPPAAPSPPSPQ